MERKQTGLKIAFWIFVALGVSIWAGPMSRALGNFVELAEAGYNPNPMLLVGVAVGALVFANWSMWIAAVLGVIFLVRRNNDRKGLAAGATPDPMRPGPHGATKAVSPERARTEQRWTLVIVGLFGVAFVALVVGSLLG